MRSFLFIIFVVLLTACDGNYRNVIKDHYEKTLFDPYSAKYRWIEGPEKKAGYTIVTFGLNAKNRYGAYTGETIKKAIIRNGEIVLISDVD